MKARMESCPHGQLRSATPPLLLLGLLLSCALHFASCNMETEVENIDLPNEPQRIVINALLDPLADSVIVHVNSSIPVRYNKTVTVEMSEMYNKRFPSLPDAQVSIEEVGGTEKHLLSYSKARDCFIFAQSSFPLHRGKEYAVRVSHSTLGEAYGVCSIPDGASVPMRMQQGGEDGFLVTLQVERTPQRYFLLHLLRYVDSRYVTMGNATLTTSESISGELRGMVLGDSADPDSYSCLIWEVNESTYRYFRRLEEVIWTERDFLAFPARPYGNVEGGLGIVGGIVLLDTLRVVK